MTAPHKFELGQKLEVHSIPEATEEYSLNGKIVFVTKLPGCSEKWPECYEVVFADRTKRLAFVKNLRPYPPSLPNGRGDCDVVTSWEQFEKATGIPRAVILNGPAHGET